MNTNVKKALSCYPLPRNLMDGLRAFAVLGSRNPFQAFTKAAKSEILCSLLKIGSYAKNPALVERIRTISKNEWESSYERMQRLPQSPEELPAEVEQCQALEDWKNLRQDVMRRVPQSPEELATKIERCHALEELTQMYQASVDEKGQITNRRVYDEAAQRVYNDYSDLRMNTFTYDPSSNCAPPALLESATAGPEFVLALQHLLELRASGLVHRLRHCKHCHKWFYARVPSGQFCCGECEKYHRESNDQWKKAHNRISKRSYHVRMMRKARQLLRGARTPEWVDALKAKIKKHDDWLKKERKTRRK